MLRLIAVNAFLSLILTGATTVPMHKGHVLWSKKVSEHEVGNGNAIVHANDSIYVGDDKCNIHVLDMMGNEIGKISGEADASCRSPFTFALDSSYFVQTIGYNDDFMSRVVAYDANTLGELYNVLVPGHVEGSPVVSSDGAYTFIVYNIEITGGFVAEFCIIQNSDGSILFKETSLNSTSAYAPLGVGRSPIRGNYAAGSKNSNDILVWGEKYVAEQGVDDANGVTLFDGKIHFFQLPKNYNPSDNSLSLATKAGNDIGKVTLAAPIIPKHGQGCIFSFHASQVRGWSRGHYFGRSPSLKYSVKKEFDNPTPGPNSGTFAFNDTIHIISSASGSPSLYAFQIMENITDPFESRTKQLWNISTTSMVYTKVKTAFNDSIAFFVESGGVLVCIDTLTGEMKWRHNTGGHVKADFAVFNDTYLAFGTTNGYTTLVRIGDLKSESPSTNPTTVPSSSPSISPSNVPSVLASQVPSTKPSNAPIVESSEEPSTAPSVLATPSGTPVPTMRETENPSHNPTIASIPLSLSSVAGVTSASASIALCSIHIVIATALAIWLY